MTTNDEKNLHTRETILALLSDAEVAKVSTSEAMKGPIEGGRLHRSREPQLGSASGARQVTCCPRRVSFAERRVGRHVATHRQSGRRLRSGRDHEGIGHIFIVGARAAFRFSFHPSAAACPNAAIPASSAGSFPAVIIAAKIDPHVRASTAARWASLCGMP